MARHVTHLTPHFLHILVENSANNRSDETFAISATLIHTSPVYSYKTDLLNGVEVKGCMPNKLFVSDFRFCDVSE